MEPRTPTCRSTPTTNARTRFMRSSVSQPLTPTTTAVDRERWFDEDSTGRPHRGAASRERQGKTRSSGRFALTQTTIDDLATTVGRGLAARGWLLATAESCTGGLVAGAITDVAGSSTWFDRGFISYSNQAKHELLGVA